MIQYVASTEFLLLLVKMLVVFGGVMGALAYTTLLERRVMAFVQMRPGPNRVGPMGLLQPIADGLKFLFKEQVVPSGANTFLYYLAPIVSLIPALLSPLMGAMRSSAQMLSYELSLTLSVVGVLMIANSLNLNTLVESQSGTWFGFIPRWNIFIQPVAFVVYLLSGIAETNRLPFDLAESEQELVAGWHTEYSGMKFAMFFLAEYANMVTVSALATIMFLGGWNGPAFGPEWLQMLLPTFWFVAKIAGFIFFYILVRATVPRIRYDQLMYFGWKVLLPLALANILVTSFIVAIS
jgi:NADH-quinone oxidoreductase subunit H